MTSVPWYNVVAKDNSSDKVIAVLSQREAEERAGWGEGVADKVRNLKAVTEFD